MRMNSFNLHTVVNGTLARDDGSLQTHLCHALERIESIESEIEAA